MYKKVTVISYFLIIGLFSTCYAQLKSSPDDKRAEQVPQKAIQAVAPSYRIGIGDVVAINVYQEDDLSATVRVGEGGVISFPLLGNVRIAGMSVAEATSEITSRLKDGYLVNPVVAISLLEQSKATFTILGQVAKPGPHEMPANGSTTLLEAVGIAGGFSRIANPSKITVKRSDGTVLKVNAKEQTSGSAPAFRVLPGDVITVPESLF